MRVSEDEVREVEIGGLWDVGWKIKTRWIEREMCGWMEYEVKMETDGWLSDSGASRCLSPEKLKGDRASLTTLRALSRHCSDAVTELYRSRRSHLSPRPFSRT